MSIIPARTRWRVPVALFIAAAAVAGVGAGAVSRPGGSPQSQTSARPSGMIVGRVVDGTTNQPVPGALVTLGGGGLRARRVIVDAQGRFFFTELPAGAFTIDATKTGFLDGTYGRLRADGAGRPLELQDGEHVTGATILLWRFGTISGTVIDDAGDPVQYAGVQVLRRVVSAGHWRFANNGLVGSADERGAYRVTGLTPGTYALVLTSLITTVPPSLLSAAEAERREPSGLLRDLQAKGTAGLANDLYQSFPVVKVGDLMLQTSPDRTAIGPDGSTIEVYPTVWYQAAATPADATLVRVGAGDTRSGIDFRPVLTKAVRVSGVVTGPDGPVSHLALRLVPARIDDAAAEISTSLARSFVSAMTASDASGAFTFLGVPPGQYILRALTTPRAAPEPAPASTVVQTANGMSTAVPTGPAPPPLVATDPTLWAAVPVSVGDDGTTGVSVALRSGLRVTGKVEFSGTAAPPDSRALRAIRLWMDPDDGHTVWIPNAYQAQIDQDGRFYTIGLVSGRYVLRVDNVPRGWTVKSAVVNGRDILDAPLPLENGDVDGLVLTFTDRPAGISGTVRDAQGRPDDNATVIIFPSDSDWMNLGPSPRRLRSVRASRTGTFAITPLPAGTYFVAAVSDALAADWQEPAFLQKLARVAARTTVTDGQTATVSLVTAGGIER